MNFVVAGNVPAADMAVLSITQIKSGDAYNVIPQTATMAGTVRTMKRETMALIDTALRRVVSGVATGMGADADVDFRLVFAPLSNDRQAMNEIADLRSRTSRGEQCRSQPAARARIRGFPLYVRESAGCLRQSRERQGQRTSPQ